MISAEIETENTNFYLQEGALFLFEAELTLINKSRPAPSADGAQTGSYIY